MSIFGTGGNPFANPGGLANFWLPPNTTGSNVLEDNPTAGYQAYLDAYGQGGDNTPMARFFNNQYGRIHNQYLAANAKMASTTGSQYRFLDFLRDNGSNLWTQYQAMPASAQGQNPSQFAGKLRWVV